MSVKLEGIVTPLITPLTPEEELDEPALRRLIACQIDGGIRGLFVLGSAGEGNALSHKVRDRVVAIAREEISGRVPLLAGVGSTCVREALDRACAAREAGAEAIVLTLPHYHNVDTQEEARTFVESVMAGVDLPVALYNIPVKTKLRLEPSTLADLAKNPSVIAVKDSCCDFTYFQRLLHTFKNQSGVAVMTGGPWHVGAAVLMGAAGAVTATANVDPEGAVALYEAAKSRDVDGTRRLQERMSSLRDIYGTYGMLHGLKFSVSLKSLCTDRCVAPAAGLTREQKRDIENRLRQNGFLSGALASSISPASPAAFPAAVLPRGTGRRGSS